MTTHVRLLAIMLACISLAGCGFYSAEPITARVVDADTGVPLEGANVIAAWKIKGGFNYGNVVGYMNVLEAVTDKDGRFHFPGWGPRANTHFGGKIRQAAPELLIFKSGYRYTGVENHGSSLGFVPSDMKSSWDGGVIAMQRFRGTAIEYEASLATMGGDISTLSQHGELLALPMFRCTLARQREALVAEGVHNVYAIPRSLDDGIECNKR